jgi:hypothetical protein
MNYDESTEEPRFFPRINSKEPSSFEVLQSSCGPGLVQSSPSEDVDYSVLSRSKNLLKEEKSKK